MNGYKHQEHIFGQLAKLGQLHQSRNPSSYVTVWLVVNFVMCKIAGFVVGAFIVVCTTAAL